MSRVLGGSLAVLVVKSIGSFALIIFFCTVGCAVIVFVVLVLILFVCMMVVRLYSTLLSVEESSARVVVFGGFVLLNGTRSLCPTLREEDDELDGSDPLSRSLESSEWESSSAHLRDFLMVGVLDCVCFVSSFVVS